MMSLSLSRVADGLVAVLLAPACAACGTSLSQPSRGPVCVGCWNAVARFTPSDEDCMRVLDQAEHIVRVTVPPQLDAPRPTARVPAAEGGRA